MAATEARSPSVDLAAVGRELRRALEWIYSDVAQPEGALISHHGIYCSTTFPREPIGRVSLSVCPRGYAGRPVVVFNLRDVPLDKRLEPTNPFTPLEISALETMVVSLAEVRDDWNGEGLVTYSVGLARAAGAGAIQLVDTYRAGCPHEESIPDHAHSLPNTVFCNTWFSAGYKLAQLPEGWR